MLGARHARAPPCKPHGRVRARPAHAGRQARTSVNASPDVACTVTPCSGKRTSTACLGSARGGGRGLRLLCGGGGGGGGALALCCSSGCGRRRGSIQTSLLNFICDSWAGSKCSPSQAHQRSPSTCWTAHQQRMAACCLAVGGAANNRPSFWPTSQQAARIPTYPGAPPSPRCQPASSAAAAQASQAPRPGRARSQPRAWCTPSSAGMIPAQRGSQSWRGSGACACACMVPVARMHACTPAVTEAASAARP